MKRPTHGHSRRGKHSPTYRSWTSMRRRCTLPSEPGYDHYGGRGITVCDRWASFETFLADMGERPAGKTLDRIDRDGHYTPENCRWADADTQIRNRCYTVNLTHNGQTMCMKDWARTLGIPYQTLRERIRRGWPHELALTTPPSFRNSGLKMERLPHQNPIRVREHWPTACAKGHALTPENSRRGSSGKPYCKTCEKAKYRLRMGWPEHMAYDMKIRVPAGYMLDRDTGEFISTKGRLSRSASESRND